MPTKCDCHKSWEVSCPIFIAAVTDCKCSSLPNRPQSWSRNSQFQLDSVDSKLNLVILGNLGLADQLVQEIRVCGVASILFVCLCVLYGPRNLLLLFAIL